MGRFPVFSGPLSGPLSGILEAILGYALGQSWGNPQGHISCILRGFSSILRAILEAILGNSGSRYWELWVVIGAMCEAILGYFRGHW